MLLGLLLLVLVGAVVYELARKLWTRLAAAPGIWDIIAVVYRLARKRWVLTIWVGIFIVLVAVVATSLDYRSDNSSNEVNETVVLLLTATPTRVSVPIPTPVLAVPSVTPTSIPLSAATPTIIPLPAATSTSIPLPVATPTSIPVPTTTPNIPTPLQKEWTTAELVECDTTTLKRQLETSKSTEKLLSDCEVALFLKHLAGLCTKYRQMTGTG